MSDFDEELEEDLDDAPAEEEEADDFEDPQQTTAALTMEINKLRQKNELLRQFNVKQKDRYKDEVRSFLSPLIQKYKDLQSENDFLKRQIKEIGQSKEYFSKAKEIGENGGSHDKEDFVKLMESTIQEKEHEIAVLNKMVKTLEEESYNLKRGAAELPELKDSLKQKSSALSKLEEEKFDLISKVEAKESLTDRYLKQISDLETNIYVLNKRISERTGQFENGKVSEYEDKLGIANEKVEKLNQKIYSLEKQLSDYKQTMSSLEEELEEEEFLKSSTSAISIEKQPVETIEEDKPAEVYDYTKLYKDDKSAQDEVALDIEDEYISSDELPSDDDLLAEDIELEELSLEEEPTDNSVSLENDDLTIEELPVELDELSIEEQETEQAIEENVDIDSFDDLQVDDLIDEEDLLLEDSSNIDLNQMGVEAEETIDKKHYDLRATNIENVKILSELKLETSPFKEGDATNDVSNELFDDELPVEENKSVKS